jgi:hypothetical protein
MEESVLFPLEKSRVKLGTVLIETVLSGDYLYYKIIRKNDKEGRV